MGRPNFSTRTVWTGDNLDILRGMNSESVDLIYLDPPFNSNKTYSAPIGSKAAGAAFKDTWTLDDVDEAWHGEIADRDPTLYAIIDAAGLAHSASMKSYLIMMAVRLLEMRRVLKPAGSIYLHCDPTAGHYLKTLMDAVFGAREFYTEITWQRSNAHNDKTFGAVSDAILYYGRAPQNEVRIPLDSGYVARMYRHRDKLGRYNRMGDLTGPGTTSGESSRPWRGIKPDKGRCWSVPKSGRYAKWIAQKLIPNYLEIEGIHARLDALDKAGLIYWPSGGTIPKLKRYLASTKGRVAGNVWTDIHRLVGPSKERTGYPTQKPVKLLDRIIRASSNPGDMVLDPFCGCATTLVVAETLGRRWAGIDLSPLAVRLVGQRLRDQHGLFGQIVARDDIPRRTDLGELPNYRTHRHTLYGRQEGVCNGCLIHFPFRNLTVDHIVPQSKGGTDHIDNLQLLCGACNSKKGSRPMEELVADLLVAQIRPATPDRRTRR